MMFSTRAEDFEKIKTMRQKSGMTTEQAVAALLGEQKRKAEQRRLTDLAPYEATL